MDRYTQRQTDGRTKGQTDRQTDGQTYIQTNTQTSSQAGRHTDDSGQADKNTCIPAVAVIDSSTGAQTRMQSKVSQAGKVHGSSNAEIPRLPSGHG